MLFSGCLCGFCAEIKLQGTHLRGKAKRYGYEIYIPERWCSDLNKKGSNGPAAVIEIGSSAVRMRVSQLRHGEIETLDALEYPVYLGHEVFNEGRIRFESLRQLSSILSKFTSALADYGCKNLRVVSSTVMREAENRSFVADQLKIHNNLNLEILEYSEEKALICSEIIRLLKQKNKMNMENTVIAYIGTGSIGIALYDGKAISVSQNVPIGSLKLHDALSTLSRENDAFYPVIEEYMDIVFNRVDIPASEIRSIILTGSDLELVASVCGAEKNGDLFTISAKKMRAVYDEIRSMSYSAIARRYGISEDLAEILYTALSIYTGMLRLCKDQSKIICPDIDICDAVTRHMLIPGAQAEYQAQIHESALVSARRIAEKYNCHGTHSAAVSSFACTLFDKMKNVHGLPADRKIILELAAILHSCGQYINVRTHTQCSFDLIKNFDIFGMTAEHILLTAFVSGYNEFAVPNAADFSFLSLSEEKRLEISKLVAIFRLSNALDKSKRQKLKISKVKITNDKLEIKAETTGNALLEKWAFEECAGFFKEVFGLSPELHIRSNLL